MKKEEEYIVYVGDTRFPTESKTQIAEDYSLRVVNQARSGFDLVGTLANINAFVEDYCIILDDEPNIIFKKD